MFLFVCSVARLRSRTAELLCLFGGVDARCCGVEDNALYAVSDSLLREADFVFCMKEEHKEKIKEYQHYEESKVFVLNIEDEYDRLEPSLVKHLVARVGNINKELAEKMQFGFDIIEASGYLEVLGTHKPYY